MLDSPAPVPSAERTPDSRDLLRPFALPVSVPLLVLVLPLFPRGCSVVPSPVQNRIDDRPLLRAGSSGAAAVSVQLELLLPHVAARGAIDLFDPLIDLGTVMPSVVVSAGAGDVAGFVTVAEVALGVGRTAVVLCPLEVVWSTFTCTSGRVAGLLTFAEVALGVGRAAAVLCPLEVVWSTFT